MQKEIDLTKGAIDKIAESILKDGRKTLKKLEELDINIK
jgi:hypothetical protein